MHPWIARTTAKVGSLDDRLGLEPQRPGVLPQRQYLTSENDRQPIVPRVRHEHVRGSRRAKGNLNMALASTLPRTPFGSARLFCTSSCVRICTCSCTQCSYRLNSGVIFFPLTLPGSCNVVQQGAPKAAIQESCHVIGSQGCPASQVEERRVTGRVRSSGGSKHLPPLSFQQSRAAYKRLPRVPWGGTAAPPTHLLVADADGVQAWGSGVLVRGLKGFSMPHSALVTPPGD